jgi:preprotein translocase subunit SecG
MCVFLGGGVDMHTLLVTLLVIVSIAMIVVVLLQSGRSAGLSGAITGGAEQLFGKQKARGIDAVLHRMTIVLAVLFFVLTIAVTYFQL